MEFELLAHDFLFDLNLFCLFARVQVMPAVLKLMKEESTLVALVKPQFEAPRSKVWLNKENCLFISLLIVFLGR